MRRFAAILIATAMLFAVGCEPPAADDASDDTDANTTWVAPANQFNV